MSRTSRKNISIVENTHEALVSREVFLQIQENYFQTALSVDSPKTAASDNPLKGKVICASCGGKMQRRKGRGNVDWHFFSCITNNAHEAIISEDVLTAVVFDEIRHYIEKTQSYGGICYAALKYWIYWRIGRSS